VTGVLRISGVGKNHPSLKKKVFREEGGVELRFTQLDAACAFRGGKTLQSIACRRNFLGREVREEKQHSHRFSD